MEAGEKEEDREDGKQARQGMIKAKTGSEVRMGRLDG